MHAPFATALNYSDFTAFGPSERLRDTLRQTIALAGPPDRSKSGLTLQILGAEVSGHHVIRYHPVVRRKPDATYHAGPLKPDTTYCCLREFTP